MLSRRLSQEVVEAGSDAGLLARAVDSFRSQQAAGAFPGDQLVAGRHGKLIVNAALGVAHGYGKGETGPTVQVASGTPFPAYSCGKPLAAVAVAISKGICAWLDILKRRS